MSKARDLADFISTGSILSDGTIESTEISGVTADATEINKLDGLTADTTELNTLDGVTATTAELNKLTGTTATTSDFDKLSNVTASATELNYMSGATSSIQSQLDNISVTSGSLTKSFTNGETASITLSSALSTAPVVGVTKEVAQTGISSKGAWDVNATASNYELHNTAYDTTLAKSSVAVSNISDFTDASKNFQTTTFGASPNPFFKTDGTKMYICSRANAFVYQYSLSTAWDVNTASYDNKSFSTNAQTSEGDPTDIFFKPDGTLLYVVGQGNDQVYAYSLTTAWDISTATPTASNYMSTASQETAPRGIFFKSDGTVIYVVGGNGNRTFYYTMSTAWDLSTASYTGNINTATEDNGPNGINFNSSGTKMYLLGGSSGNGKIFQYNLTTAWDLTTASYSSNFLDISGYTSGGVAKGIALVDNDTRLYFGAGTSNPAYVHQLDGFSNALTLGTGSFASTDVGKRIQGNGGDVILTSTAGAYDTTGGSDFTDTSTIASGSWTMHGLKSAGATDGLTIAGKAEGGVYDFSAPQAATSTQPLSSTKSIRGFTFNSTGTQVFYVDDNTNSIIWQDLSTAYDLTTVSGTSDTGLSGSGNLMGGPVFKPDGLSYYYTEINGERIWEILLSTAYTPGSATSTRSLVVTSQDNYPFAVRFSPDGSDMIMLGRVSGSGRLYRYYRGATAWEIDSYTYQNASINIPTSYGAPLQGEYTDFIFNDDGTKIFVVDDNNDTLVEFDLDGTAYRPDGGLTYVAHISNGNTSSSAIHSIAFNGDGSKVMGIDLNGTPTAYTRDLLSFVQPTSQYHIAATNSGGQIDTGFWTDINSMTADQSLGDGEAYYAVSTDDRTTWSVAKASDGVRPIVRDNAGTWQYNNDQGTTVGYDIANASYDSKSLSLTGQSATAPRGMAIKPDGTKIFVGDESTNSILQYDLSTANDISTASYANKSLSVSGADTGLQGIAINNDGTRFYMLGSNTDYVYQYDLSTAYDISTANSTASGSFYVGGQSGTPRGLAWKPDGTKLYIVDGSSSDILEYSVSTAYNVSTATTTGFVRFDVTQVSSLSSMAFNSDGTKMFAFGYGGDRIEQFSLSTAYDISTASYDSVSFHLGNEDGTIGSIDFNSDGTKLFASGQSTNAVYQYSTGAIGFTTSTTWTNATTNDEFYALQQALGATSVNRMDKTQLDAVADGSHFTLGDTLDLAIALKQDTASASLPTSDGVTINYDAQALNQGAVLGTDYDYDFPDSTTVRITSNAAQNLKIRVV
jgi:6-phosphogluconolactonase (cycloisomerase 2 family)